MSKVFISYSHKDEAWKDRLQSQLTVLEIEGFFSVWEDRQIALGDNWYPEIETALNTADVAILLITADFLTSQFILAEEIPRLLERREKEGIRVIPLILKPCPWRKVKWLSALQGASRDNVELSGLTEHEQDSVLSKLAEKVHDLVSTNGDTTQNPVPKSQNNTRIHSDRLPTVKGKFFGRDVELKMLDEAWQQDNSIRIMQFIAPGGTGKTKLLRHWLDKTEGIEALIAWSFYSQGASEDKQTSASPFFSHIFKKLGATQTDFDSDEDKGEYLAELLCERRCVLVLDGLEPMQYADNANRGELKDRALKALLKNLAGRNTGLCIITTRIAVHELSDRYAAFVVSHKLENLAPTDGVKLLQSLGVKGQPAELNKAVNEYGRHALALNLLGNVLRLRYEGDVHKRDTLKALVKPSGSKESQHAFKVMQAYAEWFAGEPELDLLHLLGLFDHPIEQEVLQVLWGAQIPNLTEGIDEDSWLEAIAGLREEHHLLSQHDDSNDLDCHPLIREYFGNQLKDQQPDAWQQAHETLYHYYKELPDKELPETLEEMQPLFSAVAHGCAAGLYQQTLDEVYYSRIQRDGGTNYLSGRLGAFSDDLSTIAHFFITPWYTLAAALTDSAKAVLLSFAGFRLRALGRLREALEPIQAGMELSAKQENWKNAAADASSLSGLQLTLGDLAQAELSGQRSVDYADQSGDIFSCMAFRAIYANALHQTGETELALALFREAEQLQQERQPEYQRMYSLQGFQYCNLLLTQSSENNSLTEMVLERAEYSIKIAKRSKWLLGIALDQLTLGCAYFQQHDIPKTTHWLNQAVTGLRAAGRQDYLPVSLLSRTTLHRHNQNFTLAHKDLQEVHDIAEPSGMRLYLTDYHLEMARLLLAEQASDDEIQRHIQSATQLIEATGYNRRLPELQALRLSITQ